MVDAVFPPACAACGTPVATVGTLCGACFGGVPFLTGLTCDRCAAPLPGKGAGDELCDACLNTARPWCRGRAVALYDEGARDMILSLKHGDRPDLAQPWARWLSQAAADLLEADSILVPVPLHRLRFLRRRYNQSAEVARRMAALGGWTCLPDALLRTRITRPARGLDRAERFANLDGAIGIKRGRAGVLAGRPVLLIDDVMASGATLAACAAALEQAGPSRIDVAVLARAAWQV